MYLPWELCATDLVWFFGSFLTFYYVEKRNGILRKNLGEGCEKSYIPSHGRGVKNCQNHPYVINEWPLKFTLWHCMCNHGEISRFAVGMQNLGIHA